MLKEENEDDIEKKLRLKGQMIYMDNWRLIMFLGTPVMPKLSSLISTGLYINDLSMHDFSRYNSVHCNVSSMCLLLFLN